MSLGHQVPSKSRRSDITPKEIILSIQITSTRTLAQHRLRSAKRVIARDLGERGWSPNLRLPALPRRRRQRLRRHPSRTERLLKWWPGAAGLRSKEKWWLPTRLRRLKQGMPTGLRHLNLCLTRVAPPKINPLLRGPLARPNVRPLWPSLWPSSTTTTLEGISTRTRSLCRILRRRLSRSSLKSRKNKSSYIQLLKAKTKV